MNNVNLVNYIFIYGQVISQLIMYISIIYLICFPLREALYAARDYFKYHTTSKETNEQSTKEL